MTRHSRSIRSYDRTLATLSRRELLNIAWKLGAAAVAAPTVSSRVYAQMLFETYPFTLGVASGDPWPDSVLLWTRIAPRPLEGGGMPMANLEVAWELAAERAFTKIVRKGVAVARPELGHAVHVEVAGLEPGRDYFYRFRAGREVSPVGRTKTAPAAGSAVDELRFAVCGCNHYETGYFTAFRRIAREPFVSSSTPATTSTGRDNGGANETLVSATMARRSTPSWITATGTRSTSPIRI